MMEPNIWAVVSIMDIGNQTLPSVGDPIANVTDANNVISSEWTFDSLVTTPIIIEDPADILDFPGASVSTSINVSSKTQEHYEWFKSTDNANDTSGDDTAASGDNDSDTVSFTLPTVQGDYANYEGYYYCKVSNDATVTGGGSEPDVLSAVFKVAIKRQMAYWTLNSPLTDREYADTSTEDPITDNIKPDHHPGVTFAAGPYGLGADSAVIINDDSSGTVQSDNLDLHRYSNELTISVWIKRTGDLPFDDSIAVIAKCDSYNTEAEWRWGLVARDGDGIRLMSWSGLSAWASNALTLNEWVHVAATISPDDGNAYVYVNGMEAASDSTVEWGPKEDAVVHFGRTASNGQTFPGQIDDVKLYNYGMDKFGIADLFYDVSGENICIKEYADTFDTTGPLGVPDCKVDLIDFAEYVSSWLSCGLYPNCP